MIVHVVKSLYPPKAGKLLVSNTLHVRYLQVPTASSVHVNGQVHTSPCVCSLVLNDLESSLFLTASGGALG